MDGRARGEGRVGWKGGEGGVDGRVRKEGRAG